MNLKEFLNQNEIFGFEVIPNQLIMNIITLNEEIISLDIDTSSIPGGSKLETKTNFIIQGDILTIENLSINIEETNVLSSEEIR